MKRSLIGSVVVCGAMLFALFYFGTGPAPVAAQGQAPLNAQGDIAPVDPNWKPEGPVPRMPDGKPDLSGVWWQGGDFNFGGRGRAGGGARAQGPAVPRVTWQSLYRPEIAAKAKTLSDKD